VPEVGDPPPLTLAVPRGPVRAIAVVLHGGRANSTAPVRARQLAVLRMRPFAESLRRAGADHGLVVARLRYRVRGWNGELRSPVADAAAGLDELVARYPGRPLALIGHSMGGRAAMYVAGHDHVRTVVGLAPWLTKGDPVAPLAGRRVMLAHGDHDRMTSPRATAAFARAARSVAESISFVSVAGDGHAMLRRAGLWHALSTGFVLGTLFDLAPDAALPRDVAGLLARALAGEHAVAG
jgi:pimeloyl-ACP methyl ester carboxylesterase